MSGGFPFCFLIKFVRMFFKKGFNFFKVIKSRCGVCVNDE